MKNFWNLKLSRIIGLFLITLPYLVQAQFSESKIKFAAEEKYLYPVNPGKPGSLAGNMGELRTTHFHSGIDVRTDNRVGMAVYASKSGYVSRAIVSTSGYGNVIYITHPDGNTTLYAHLSQFAGALGDSVLKERYVQKTSEIDLTFSKGKFLVKRGEVIALSGNSGGSTGPHLHFDIRDSSNNALNPLLFGFEELLDKAAPAAEKIALQTLDINSRINDRFGRFEFYAQRIGNNYILAQPILASGNIGIEILAKDKFAVESAFYGGVNYLEMLLNNQLIFSQAIEKLDVAETRTIYALTNFKTMRTKGTRFYKLYIDDGNDLKFYQNLPGKGKINVKGIDDLSIQVNMRDSYNNKSTASFKLRPTPVIKEVKNLETLTTDILFDVTENVLMVMSKPCTDSTRTAQVFCKGIVTKKEPDYYNEKRSVYLFDLRKTIPDSVVVCSKSIKPEIRASIPSGTEYRFYDDIVDIQFPNNALYDTLYLNIDHQLTKEGAEIFTIGNRTTPLNKPISVTLQPKQPITWTKSTAVYRVSGKSSTFLGGEFENGKVKFNTREFGDFIVLNDTTPPTIKPVYTNGVVARFKIKDNLSGISSFDATINGQWLLFNYDYKTGMIWSEKLDKKIPLKGELILTVIDNVGNENVYKKYIP